MRVAMRLLLCATLSATLAGLNVRESVSSEKDQRELRAVTYSTPEEVFHALQQGLEAGDAKTVWNCLTEKRRENYIFDAWGEQYHHQHEPPTLGKVIDEELRLKLTREHLPTKPSELPPLLMRSIKDKEAAFAMVLDRVPKQRGLKHVTIDQDIAKGEIIERRKRWTKDGIVTSEVETIVVFRQDEQGWRIEEGYPNEIREKPSKGKPSKPWREVEPAKYESPHAVFAAYQQALHENDPETAWHCLTERRRGAIMVGGLIPFINGGGGDYMMGWYLNMDEWMKARESKDIGVRLGMQLFHDPKAFFSALHKDAHEDSIDSPQWFKSLTGPLVNVEIIDGRARGETRTDGVQPFWFTKTDRGWIMDLGTKEEGIRERERRAKEEAQQDGK